VPPDCPAFQLKPFDCSFFQVHQLCLDKDELLLRSFHVFDKDNSGFITEQELREAMCCKGGQVGGRGRGVLKRQAL
jgi:hypothetical protein